MEGFPWGAVPQALVSGLLIGGVYGLMALGLTMIFGVLRVINFAHGAFVMLGMYLAFWSFALWRVDPYVSLLWAVPLFVLAGGALQSGVLRRVLAAPQHTQLLVTLAVALVVENTALLLWGPDFRTIRVGYSIATVSLLGTIVSLPRLAAFATAAVAALALWALLKHTDLGRAIRATAQDREAAALMGLPVDRVHATAFGIGTACAAIAGIVTTPFFHVSPDIGNTFVILAFVIVVLGGLGSFPGALLGGVIVGVVESLGAVFLPGSLKELLIYAVFLLVLVLRPEGLLAPRGRRG
jgi:branched-chain amino acid transport system permease protein